MGLDQYLFSQPPSGNLSTKAFNDINDGYNLAKEFGKYKPPSPPPIKPPVAPPKGPGGFGMGGNVGSFVGGFVGGALGGGGSYANLGGMAGGLAGGALGGFLGGMAGGALGGMLGGIVDDYVQPPGQDKQIEPPIPPPFMGGQVPGQLYVVKFFYEYVSDIYQGEVYTQTQGGVTTQAYGPIGGFKHGDLGYGDVWYLEHNNGQKLPMFQGSPTIAWYNAKTPQKNPSPQCVKLGITEIIPVGAPPGFQDQNPPPTNLGTISLGSTGGLGPLNAPLTTPPGIKTPPGVKAPPGTEDDKDKDKEKSPFPFFNPGTNNAPGTNNNPGFDPLGNLAPAPSPNPLTSPAPSTTPGTSPGTNTNPGTSKQGGTTGLMPPLFMPPGIDNKTGQNTNFSPTPDPKAPSVNTQPGNCQTGCTAPLSGKLDNQDKKLDDLGNKLDVINAGANAGQLAQLNEVLDRLGPKVNGGLSGFLKGKFEKLWESKALDRALALMNLAASIHNAVMLSRNIGQTLVATFTNILALIGIKDPDGKASSFTEAIGNTIENFIKGIIGAENYTELTTTWKKANRIYQAAINTYQLLTDSLFAVAEGLELIGKYTGKVGNALKKSGTVLESSYEWFGETFNFKSKRNRAIDQLIQGLQTGQEVASDLQEITENFREAQENINEIGEQINTVKTETQTQVTAKTTKESSSKTNSQTPDIPKSAMIQPPPPPPAT